ncbi:LysR family transcriptional regulator [Clostridium sp.]|uniref:LysR family transcriptional regulator n=1 Tax=Clostridium sp. TaxID=1506 RepID=UPI00307B9648
MNQRFSAFLLAAETLSISKAAELNFVSYQCISSHIRSLEEEYGVKLFDRHPKFALTEEGCVLLASLQKIRAIEGGIAESLNGQGKEVSGRVTLGIPMSRYTEIVPAILARFKGEYKNVELEIVHDYSTVLQHQVERGMLDMAVVVLKEQFLFLISNALMDQCLGERAASFRQRCKKRGITLDEIAQFPIVSYPKASRLRTIMDNYANHRHMTYNTVFTSNRTETFDAIARTDVAGCIISQQIYGITARNNRRLRVENRLQVFRINMGNYKIDSNIMLIHSKDAILAPYKQHLIQIITDEFSQYDQLAKNLR